MENKFLACEQALLFGQAKRASRERLSASMLHGHARHIETRLKRKVLNIYVGFVAHFCAKRSTEREIQNRFVIAS